MSMMTVGTEKPFLFLFSIFLLFLYVLWQQLFLHPNFLFSFEKRWAGLYWQVAWGGLQTWSSQVQSPPFNMVPYQTPQEFVIVVFFCWTCVSLTSCSGNPFSAWTCNHNEKQLILHWIPPTKFFGLVFCCGYTPELQASVYIWLHMTHRIPRSLLRGLRCLL